MPTQYSFVTHWKIKAPVANVWDAIYLSTEWPQWWKGVKKVVDINTGDIDGLGAVRDYTWQSILPYTLTFSIKLTEKDTHKKLSGVAFGDLEGHGTWIFEEVDGITSVTYYWNVITNKPWMNYLSFILKPAFKFNHDVVMKWGEKGLKTKLEK